MDSQPVLFLWVDVKVTKDKLKCNGKDKIKTQVNF